MYPLLFHFGNLAIPTYGVLTALGLLAALALAMQQGARLRVNAEKMWTLGLVAILASLFAARLLVIAAHMRAFRAHPFWVLGLTSIQGDWVAVGGAAIGVVSAGLYALAQGLPLLRTADGVAPAAALGFAINRIGAFCGGLGWGRPTTLPWGVTYRKAVAYVWYGTPLGIPLHPVQLYDAGSSLAILALLLWMARRGTVRHGGEMAGAWLFLYGLCRFFVEFLRGDTVPALGGFLTLAQGLSILAVFMGGVLWLRRAPASMSA